MSGRQFLSRLFELGFQRLDLLRQRLDCREAHTDRVNRIDGHPIAHAEGRLEILGIGTDMRAGLQPGLRLVAPGLHRQRDDGGEQGGRID